MPRGGWRRDGPEVLRLLKLGNVYGTKNIPAGRLRCVDTPLINLSGKIFPDLPGPNSTRLGPGSSGALGLL